MSYVPIVTPKSRLTSALVQHMCGQEKYFITLEARFTRTDFVELNSQLRQWSLRINDYCYGRSYKRREKKLKIAGAIERGDEGRLHAHLLLGHNDDCTHEWWRVDYLTRKTWYKVIGARGSIFGSLVDVQPIRSVAGVNQYSNKSGRIWQLAGEFNAVYL